MFQNTARFWKYLRKSISRSRWPKNTRINWKKYLSLKRVASVEEAISSEIKHLMLKIKYLTLYLCLFFCYKGYFSQRKNTFFSNGKIKRVSPHNFKLTFRYVAILQSGSFALYRVTRCYYFTESKNWFGFFSERFIKRN